MTTAGGGHRKRKTIERGVGGFLRGAPLNIYPDWRGLGMQCDGSDFRTRRTRRDLNSRAHVGVNDGIYTNTYNAPRILYSRAARGRISRGVPRRAIRRGVRAIFRSQVA